MRVRPRCLPRPSESASFPTLFRSILVAAFAAEGCGPQVTPAPDAAAPDAAAPDAAAPDADVIGPGLPFEDVCPAEEGNYSVQNRLDALRGAARLDYLEMRTIDRSNHWDGGLNPNASWMTSGAAGVRCATATSAGACEAAFAALQNDPPSGRRRVGLRVHARRRGRRRARRRRDRRPVCTHRRGRRGGVHRGLPPRLAGGLRRLRAPARRRRVGGARRRALRLYVPERAATDPHAHPRARRARRHVDRDRPGDHGHGRMVPGAGPPPRRAARRALPCDRPRGPLPRDAHMEAASVFAFESLARELAALGAPPALVADARRSADDERRHARVMGRLAGRAGAAVPPVEVEAPRARTAFAIARENAVEGCVHETWAAMEALAQSSRAARPGVAAAMGPIADDEVRHAALAWQVAAWLEPRLSEAERAAVREAREGARAALAARVARGYDRGLGEALGLPPPGLAVRLVASLHAALA
nr:ferritin-like domain-containing protein [Deltaproteobacteria bacterium]